MLSLAYSFGRLKPIAVSSLYAAFYRSPVTEPTLTKDVPVAKEKFPNDAIFTRLRQMTLEKPDLLFHDDYGVDASYNDLIRDVIHLRQILREQLPASSFNADGSLKKDARSIGFLAYSGYCFIVSFFAIAALGGICVPLSTDVNAEEASYFLKKTRVTYLLTEASLFGRATEFREYIHTQPEQVLSLIQLSRAPIERNPSPVDWELDDGLAFSPTDGCLVLFTSGTTGLPKGVLLPRKMFHFTDAPPVQEIVYLASCPVHWVGGTGLIDSVLVGENLHMMKHGSEPKDFWEILQNGKITDMSVSPTLLRRLVEYYDDEIHCLSGEERETFINGSKSLKSVFTSGSQLNPCLAQRFNDLTGTHVRNGYGITEMGGGVMATPEGSAISEGYVGRPFPGVTVKLSEGDQGEVLVKTPNMFIGYFDDDEATRACFDEDGFYKTGDRAHRVGEEYYFDGRNSCDWIRFHEYTISVLELEQRLTDLPYISEAHVLPVREREAGGLVAALVRLCKHDGDEKRCEVDLRTIRENLARAGVVSYKLPTVLRVLQEGEQVPYTASGKAQKKEALRRYFGIAECMPDQYNYEGVEYWGNKLDLDASSRLYDWGGL
ncbi:acyl-CoA synthetase-like protein [Trichoderma citrinoviride]|uniref:Acyl-CoA synthetase-like protein n=1 Tax=Trichoderma citrinoviride TaxID=58853 RepID=A0A2T4AYX2_9HYPO|nr:acyl-CoA synthetase-like protein [Trichoderma citrinoviride]PTB62264.1 acyl-CoA synthetase-like protein [Trichoderma citrinoviride]